MANRDNFTAKTVEILAKRVGYLCSNPDCRKHTIGPNSQKDKVTLIGVAAHITAAAEGGPRYDETLSSEQRKDIDNGIWLCNNCSTLIDKDATKYTVDLLNYWKKEAEDEINGKIIGENTGKVGKPILEADLIWTDSMRLNRGYSHKNKELYGEVIVIGKEIPIIYWDLKWNFNFAIYNNSVSPAYNIKIEQIDGKSLNIDSLPKVNNLPPYQNINLNMRFEAPLEGTHIEADDLIKQRPPSQMIGAKFLISYQDENRKTYITTFVIHENEIENII